jgi:hypothetical protein
MFILYLYTMRRADNKVDFHNFTSRTSSHWEPNNPSVHFKPLRHFLTWSSSATPYLFLKAIDSISQCCAAELVELDKSCVDRVHFH